MTRVFLGLAVVDGFLLTATYLLGWVWGGNPHTLVHFYFGLFSVVFNLAVHCLVFIYFLGTGRWVKEVAIAYDIPDEPLPKLTRELKRWTYPVALIAMLVPIAAAAAGTAAQLKEWPWWVHATLGTLTLLINGWAFVVEYRHIKTNSRVLDEVLAEVDRIRAERGLPTNAEALAEEEAERKSAAR